MKEMYVPLEIVREIFLCLPCKALGRFRAVSNEYRSIINDQKLMEEHRKRNVKPSHLLMWDSKSKTDLHVFDMSLNSYAYMKTISVHKYQTAPPSLYGMVCMNNRDTGQIALLNPLSEEIIALADMREPFVHTSSTYYWGFGFLPKSKRYKIVRLETQYNEVLRVHMLTVEQDNNNPSWKAVDVGKRFLVCFFRQEAVCVDGVLYWEIWMDEGKLSKNVLVIDLETEEMKVIPSPAKHGNTIHASVPNLAVLEGALCCIETRSPTEDKIMPMDIWKLRHDDVNNNVDWALCYKLDIVLCYPKIVTLFPLYIYEGKRILFHNQFRSQVVGFYWYDIEDKRLTIYPSVGKVEVAAAIGLGKRGLVTATLHSETLCHPLY